MNFVLWINDSSQTQIVHNERDFLQLLQVICMVYEIALYLQDSCRDSNIHNLTHWVRHYSLHLLSSTVETIDGYLQTMVVCHT